MSDDDKKNLMELIKIGKRLKNLKSKNKVESEFLVWKKQIENNLIELYGENSVEFNEFQKIDFESSKNKLNRAYDFLKNLLTNISVRKADEEILRELEELVGEEDEEVEIFLISDDKDENKEKVAQELKEIDIHTVNINWSPRDEETLKESLEENPNIEFGISLWTRNDFDEDSEKFEGKRKLFETGYLSGLLGRNKIAILHEEEVKIPENHEKITYISLDEAWKENLVEKMNDVGYEIDLS